jgi:hypothetical protein
MPRSKGDTVVSGVVVLPQLTTPKGAFEYLIALILLTAVGMGIVLYFQLGPF